MTPATLDAFRAIADAMAGPEPRDWQWTGPHVSQRMFGITEARARAYAERHGGTARRMDEAQPSASRWVTIHHDGDQGYLCALCAERRRGLEQRVEVMTTLRVAAETACCTDCRRPGTFAHAAAAEVTPVTAPANTAADPWIKTPSTAGHQRVASGGWQKVHVKAPYSGRTLCGRIPSRLLGDARPENADTERWCVACLIAWRSRLAGVWRGPEVSR